jgi:hypothetical protein
MVHFGLKAIAAHYFFEWDGTDPPSANLYETLLGKVDILEVIQVLKDSFASVVCFGTASAFGETAEALFDVVGKANR